MKTTDLEQIAKNLNVFDKVVKVEDAPRPTWAVGGECFYDYEDALVWAINQTMRAEITECANCRLKVKSCPKCAI